MFSLAWPFFSFGEPPRGTFNVSSANSIKYVVMIKFVDGSPNLHMNSRQHTARTESFARHLYLRGLEAIMVIKTAK